MKTNACAPRVALFACGALLLTLVAPRSATAQDATALGAAIAQTCGGMDPATQGVLAGIVADSLTQDPLPNARVKIVWQGGSDLTANSATVDQSASTMN